MVAGLLACGMPQVAGAAPDRDASLALAQATTNERAQHWTRQRLDAAKKRWARNQQKFRECSFRLADEKKTRRMSLHQQGHFLDTCMREKP